MITPNQIQTLVDGECSHESRALLLRQVETQPSAWRTLALALLEEQQWAKQIVQLAKDQVQAQIVQDTLRLSSESNKALSRSTRAHPFVNLSSIGLLGKSRDHSSNRGLPWMTVLAASLLIGLGIYGGSFLPTLRMMNPNGSDTSTLAELENPVEGSQDYRPLNGMLDTNMKMLVSGPNRQTEEIPIYDLNAVDHDVFVAREMYEVAKINQRLRREGFELDVRPEYYTGKLHDGRQLIVPVKHVGVKPYGL